MNIQSKAELKNCNHCEKEYPHYNTNKKGLCKECRLKEYAASHRMSEDEKKKPYPLNDNEKKRRFGKIRRDLNKCRTSAERRVIYKRELDYIEEIGILVWCTDRRISKVVERGKGKAGRNKLEKTDSKLKYPNTKDWYE